MMGYFCLKIGKVSLRSNTKTKFIIKIERFSFLYKGSLAEENASKSPTK